ncbi:hypothetical protein LTR08_008463 [Meristemomyces frigidus]|nr:hypothetical protein LTR08_008463 [Meristemomyces frigidus]
MASEGPLKRRQSLKSILSRAHKASPTWDDAQQYRPATPIYFQLHVESDHLRTTNLPVIPERSSSQRANPQLFATKERKAGSYAFATAPTLVRTPWELERAHGRPRHSHRTPARPPPQRVFEQLPREIYHCILDHLESLHATSATVDVRGRQRDLRALLLVGKRWHRVAREYLYREIWMPDHEEVGRRRLSFQRSRSRLELLRRTLGEGGGLTGMVRCLHVTCDLAATLESRDVVALTLMADIISSCPNLEELGGYYPPLYDKASVALLESLSTRTKLRAYAWDFVHHSSTSRSVSPQCSPSDIFHCHATWQQLQTLALCATPDVQLGIGVVSATIQQLPRLKHLLLSGLNRHDFHNGTLLSLPAVRSLRLERLEGITDHGIEQLAASRLAVSVERLTLVDLELTSLRTIRALLKGMCRLSHFTCVQDTSPGSQPGLASISTLSRDLYSPNLQYLHWDALVPGSATAWLADLIASGRFPSLRKVKVPCDDDGAIQALCRPIVHETPDAGDFALVEQCDSSVSYTRSLRVAQIWAQLRVCESRRQPACNVVVHDEEERVAAVHTIGSYLGHIGSSIKYSLEPDIEGSQDALSEFSDVKASRWPCAKTGEMGKIVKSEKILDLRMLL